MEYLFFVLLAAMGVYIVIPFLSGQKMVAGVAPKQQKLAGLQYRRQSLENSLAELDFDYRMGKLAESDKDQAMQTLQTELEDIEKQMTKIKDMPLDKVKEKLEKEIAARKKQLGSGKK